MVTVESLIVADIVLTHCVVGKGAREKSTPGIRRGTPAAGAAPRVKVITALTVFTQSTALSTKTFSEGTWMLKV
jgi:hypothetical protein